MALKTTSGFGLTFGEPARVEFESTLVFDPGSQNLS